MPVRPFVYMDPPAAEPYRHGLLDAAIEINPDLVPHWEYGGVEWESLAGYQSQTYPGGMTAVNGAGGAKVLQACAALAQAVPFVVYGGVETGSLGHNEDSNRWWTERARRIVELSGQHAAELALWTGSAGAAPALNAADTPKAIPGQGVTGADAVDMVTGVAVLERYLGNNYTGRGLIHAPRGAAAHLSQNGGQVTRDPDNPHVLTTALGTRWVFGAGYDGTGPAAAAPPASGSGLGYWWMYATGVVASVRGPITTPADFGQALDRASNQVALLAEQPWLLGVDLVRAAVLVKSQTAA